MWHCCNLVNITKVLMSISFFSPMSIQNKLESDDSHPPFSTFISRSLKASSKRARVIRDCDNHRVDNVSIPSYDFFCDGVDAEGDTSDHPRSLQTLIFPGTQCRRCINYKNSNHHHNDFDRLHSEGHWHDASSLFPNTLSFYSSDHCARVFTWQRELMSGYLEPIDRLL